MFNTFECGNFCINTPHSPFSTDNPWHEMYHKTEKEAKKRSNEELRQQAYYILEMMKQTSEKEDV